MQNFIHKFFITTGVTALSLLVFASKSYAQYSGTTTLSVNQKVATDCNFGSLSYNNSTGTIAKTGPYASQVTWNGTIGITCNTGTKVVISAAVKTVNSGVYTARTISSYKGEYLKVNSFNIWSYNYSYTAQPSVSITPSASIPYEIAIVMEPGTSGPGLPSGDYGYTFVLTATPN